MSSHGLAVADGDGEEKGATDCRRLARTQPLPPEEEPSDATLSARPQGELRRPPF